MNAIPPIALTVTLQDRTPISGWRVHQRKTIYLCALMLGICAFFTIIYARITWDAYREQTPGHLPIYGDFFALWSYAKIITTHPVAELYDFAILHARQVELGMDTAHTYPFPYPPTFIFLVWPLALLQYEADYLVFTLGTLALLVWVVRKTCTRLPFCLLGLIVAPATTATIFAGQAGFFAAALMTAGIRLARPRPIVAGILLGLLSYKPQLGFLVPVALVAAGLWTTFWAACVTVIVMAAAATFAFGWDIWSIWLAMLPAYADMFDNVTIPLASRPTVLANLQLLGVPLSSARAVQALVAAAVAVIVWRSFRRDPGRLAAAALLAGTILATPHAFYYDLPMVTVAMVLFIDDRMKTHATFTTAEIGILILATLFPIVMLLKDFLVPVSTVPLVLLLAAIVRRQGRSAGETGMSGLSVARSALT